MSLLRRTFLFATTAAIAGCYSDPEMPRIHTTPEGCYTTISQRGELVNLDVLPIPSFQETLLRMIPFSGPDAVHCWFRMPSNRIMLVVGDSCRPHSEYQFERKDGTWQLADSREVELVLCH
jgi:hypothetical protein